MNSGNQPALAARGAWGSIFRVDFDLANHDGTIAMFVLGTAEQSSFDNLTFLDTQTLLAAEDRGDTLHKQLNTLDSIWAYDVRKVDPNPRRFLALGRDSESESDAILLDANTPGFQNEGDNEPTGLHRSDGAVSIEGLIGKPQNPIFGRLFFTQQHGKNTVYEIVRANKLTKTLTTRPNDLPHFLPLTIEGFIYVFRSEVSKYSDHRPEAQSQGVDLLLTVSR